MSEPRLNETAGPVLHRRFLAIGAGLAALYLVILTGQRALDAYRANQGVDAARQEIATLRARNIELQKELASSDLDDRDVERTARDELGLAKPGDHPVILVWPEGGRPVTSPSLAVRSEDEPNWREWLRLFVDAEPAHR